MAQKYICSKLRQLGILYNLHKHVLRHISWSEFIWTLLIAKTMYIRFWLRMLSVWTQSKLILETLLFSNSKASDCLRCLYSLQVLRGDRNVYGGGMFVAYLSFFSRKLFKCMITHVFSPCKSFKFFMFRFSGLVAGSAALDGVTTTSCPVPCNPSLMNTLNKSTSLIAVNAAPMQGNPLFSQ